MRHFARTTLLLAALVSAAAQAQMDVDQADSLNFEAFHTDKKEAKKIWKEKDETVKAYEQPSATTTSVAPTATTAAPTAAAATATAVPVAAAAAAKPGQRFEIRERYTLGRSSSTPYSAFYVIEALHKQSAQLCPRGWKKLAERSEPVEQDFFLYYEIECL